MIAGLIFFFLSFYIYFTREPKTWKFTIDTESQRARGSIPKSAPYLLRLVSTLFGSMDIFPHNHYYKSVFCNDTSFYYCCIKCYTNDCQAKILVRNGQVC